jgi:hypothetical protein
MTTKSRKDESQSNGHGKGTFRFRYMDSNRQFEVQADNVNGENLLEGFRHVANAITGRNIAAPAPKLLKKAAGTTEVLEDQEILEPTLPFSEPAPVEPVDEREEEEATESTESTPKKTRRVKAPKVPLDIDLSTATVPLADFMAQKGNPAEMMDKFAVIAVWYKHQFNVTEMTIDRIFAAFKLLSWESQLPADVEKPLKNLTYAKQWFQKAKGPGAYEITWPGETEVNKMGAAKTT